MTDAAGEAIWHRPVTVEALNRLGEGTLAGHLGITFVEVGAEEMRASMPVDERTRQPFGLLHGGASVALAETLGSVAAQACVDAERYACVGLEINANHVRGVRQGLVYGTARPIHVGRRTQVWEIRIEDEGGRLVSISRLTLAVIERDAGAARPGG